VYGWWTGTRSRPQTLKADIRHFDAFQRRLSLRKAHQTLRRVTQDFETRWHFNLAIAPDHGIDATNLFAGAVGKRCAGQEVRKKVLELLTLMLKRDAHLAEELGNTGTQRRFLDGELAVVLMRP